MLSNLRNFDEKYCVNENSFVYDKKLSAENTAWIIMDNNGTNINYEARHFIKSIKDNWFEKDSRSAFCQQRKYLKKGRILLE